MNYFRLKHKILIPAVALVILVLGATFFTSIRQFNAFASHLSAERLRVAESSLRQFPEELRRMAIAIAIEIAADERIINGILDADREKLLAVGQSLADVHNIAFVTFMDANAIALARTHTPDSYGDIMLTPAFRDTVEGIISVAYGPMGGYAATIRASVPVHHEGTIIGGVVVAHALDRQETVDALKALYDAEFTVYIGGERMVSTVCAEDEAQLARSGFYLPIAVPNGNLFATVFMKLPTEYIDAHNRLVISVSLVMSLLGIILTIVFLYLIVHQITKPIERLAENAKKVANGDFTVRLDTTRKDEVGDMSKAFAEVVDNLRIFEENINHAIINNQQNDVFNDPRLKGSFAQLMHTAGSAIVREQLANKSKTNFLARMSHEIRTPMNAVLGVTEIELQRGTLPADTEDAFMRIYNSSNILLGLINDILDLSKVEAGKMEIIPAVYETASMIIDTVQLNLMYIGSKEIEFKLHVDENLPSFVVGDELRMKQILNNILSNAFKYTPKGEVTLSFNAVPYNDEMVYIEAKVTDTGQGMTEAQLQHLQSGEFIRFNLESNRYVEGTGLGLNIAYQLAKMMNGYIEAQSIPNAGTTFTIRIPHKINNNRVLGAEVAKGLQNLEDSQKFLRKLSKLEREPMPYGRVLVVDDVEANLFVAKGFLLPYMLNVETVESGIIALEKVKAGEVYDIIFMDHMMPEMDGVETTKKMRDYGYVHPIIALTANAFSDMADMFKSNGFTDYASKPIEINQMDRHLMKYIRDKQSPEVIQQARATATLH